MRQRWATTLLLIMMVIDTHSSRHSLRGSVDEEGRLAIGSSSMLADDLVPKVALWLRADAGIRVEAPAKSGTGLHLVEVWEDVSSSGASGGRARAFEPLAPNRLAAGVRKVRGGRGGGAARPACAPGAHMPSFNGALARRGPRGASARFCGRRPTPL